MGLGVLLWHRHPRHRRIERQFRNGHIVNDPIAWNAHQTWDSESGTDIAFRRDIQAAILHGWLAEWFGWGGTASHLGRRGRQHSARGRCAERCAEDTTPELWLMVNGDVPWRQSGHL